MKRPPRSSTGLARGATSRAPWLGFALSISIALGGAACSSDLFHDTKWQSRCDVEPDAAVCPQGTGGGDAGEATTGSATTSGAGGATTSGATTSGAGTTGATTGSAMDVTTAAASSSTG